jgi:hypothetical protein
MMFSWFAFFRHESDVSVRLDPEDVAKVASILRSIRSLRRGLLFTPAPVGTVHPFPDDEPPPMLALQLNFPRIEMLEAAAAADGPLCTLMDTQALPWLAHVNPTQQAMLIRSFPVPDPQLPTPPGGLACSYLVHYPGEAEDINAWLMHYVQHHPPLMARFPGVRGIEIYSRIDWCGGLPWPREAAMQRNRLMFDTPEALSAGLSSPVLLEMRKDRAKFPPFTGGAVHYPLLTRTIAAREQGS